MLEQESCIYSPQKDSRLNFSSSSYLIVLDTHLFSFSFRRNWPLVGQSFHRKVPIQSGDFHVGENSTNRTSILGLEVGHFDTYGHQACSTRAERNQWNNYDPEDWEETDHSGSICRIAIHSFRNWEERLWNWKLKVQEVGRFYVLT